MPQPPMRPPGASAFEPPPDEPEWLRQRRMNAGVAEAHMQRARAELLKALSAWEEVIVVHATQRPRTPGVPVHKWPAAAHRAKESDRRHDLLSRALALLDEAVRLEDDRAA